MKLHCDARTKSEHHAAWTHLYKIEAGQQADAVFGQDPLLSHRHGQAFQMSKQVPDVAGEEWLSSPWRLPRSAAAAAAALHDAVAAGHGR